MKDDSDWIPDATDLDWIESIAPTPPDAALAIETAAAPLGVPIVDRHTGRVLSALAGGRRRIVEVGTAYGASTLWMALGQPADGTIVTIDPDTQRTDLARGWWRQAGIADERIIQVSAPALEAFARHDPALAGPFDLAFIDALKHEYVDYLDALMDGRLVDGALIVADNVLWSGRVSGSRPTDPDDRATAALRSFSERVHADPRFTATILPLGDGLLVASWRGGEP
ncbi:MAG: O-methyltransferase [Chloroflexota bacterium]